MKEIVAYIQEGFYRSVSDLGLRKEFLEKLQGKTHSTYRYDAGGRQKEFTLIYDIGNLTITLKDASLKSQRRGFVIDLKNDKVWNSIKELNLENRVQLWSVSLSGNPTAKISLSFFSYRNSCIFGDACFVFDWKTREQIG